MRFIHALALFALSAPIASARGSAQTVDSTRIPFKNERRKFHTFQIRISPGLIVHQIRVGDQWADLDSYSKPSANFGAGKFGFFIPGTDEIALTNFNHYPEARP